MTRLKKNAIIFSICHKTNHKIEQFSENFSFSYQTYDKYRTIIILFLTKSFMTVGEF